MKRAFIITGAQSSGNHMLTQVFINSGCSGTVSADQYLGKMMLECQENIVWRGSMPKGGIGWWDIEKLVKKVKNNGYYVWVVIVHRDWLACASSQVKKYADIPDFKTAIKDISRAYKKIYKDVGMAGVSYVAVSYESLVFQKKHTLEGLSKTIGFNLNSDIKITDENKKWYEG